MRFAASFIIILAMTVTSSFGVCNRNRLGTDPPETTAQIFLPGVVSGPEMEYGLTVTADWAEIYFTRESTIMMMTCLNEVLTDPVPAPFSGRHIDGHPCLLPDGRRLVFVSRRPCPGASQPLNPWIVERTGSGWGEPISLGKPVINQTVHAPSISSSGTIYASGIIKFKKSSEGYLPPEPLAPDIKGYNPAIAADESFLVFSARREEGFGGSDLYVVFAGPAGHWSEPQNLGPGVNTEHAEAGPTLSMDGRSLFFSRQYDIWWVSTDVIEILRP